MQENFISHNAVKSLEDRVVELEACLAFQERTLTILDETVREFTQRMEALEKEVHRLREVLATYHE